MKIHKPHRHVERRKGNERRVQERRANSRPGWYQKNNITCERRQASYVKPFVYFALQIVLLLPVFGIVEMDLNPLRWSVFSYFFAAIWVMYATYKLFRVLGRQKELSQRRR